MISWFFGFSKITFDWAVRILSAIELGIGKNDAIFINFSLYVYAIASAAMNPLEQRVKGTH